MVSLSLCALVLLAGMYVHILCDSLELPTNGARLMKFAKGCHISIIAFEISYFYPSILGRAKHSKTPQNLICNPSKRRNILKQGFMKVLVFIGKVMIIKELFATRNASHVSFRVSLPCWLFYTFMTMQHYFVSRPALCAFPFLWRLQFSS